MQAQIADFVFLLCNKGTCDNYLHDYLAKFGYKLNIKVIYVDHLLLFLGYPTYHG
jgi:hypothetical protein